MPTHPTVSLIVVDGEGRYLRFINPNDRVGGPIGGLQVLQLTQSSFTQAVALTIELWRELLTGDEYPLHEMLNHVKVDHTTRGNYGTRREGLDIPLKGAFGEKFYQWLHNGRTEVDVPIERFASVAVIHLRKPDSKILYCENGRSHLGEDIRHHLDRICGRHA